jgi:hypothetical protein
MILARPTYDEIETIISARTISSISVRTIHLRVAMVAPSACQARSTSAPSLMSASRSSTCSSGVTPFEGAALSASNSS